MNMKKLLAVTLSASMALSTMVAVASADYGTTTIDAEGSAVLNFGTASIISSGGGSIVDDSTLGSTRTENLKANAEIMLPEIDLSTAGYNKVELYSASSNSAAVTISVGDTTVAEFADVSNGSWSTYVKNTADLLTTEASGNVKLTITGSGYCGNYAYVKFYYDAPKTTIDLGKTFNAATDTMTSYDLVALAIENGADEDIIKSSNKLTVAYDVDITSALTADSYVDIRTAEAPASCDYNADTAARYNLVKLNSSWTQVDMVDGSQKYSGVDNGPGQWLNVTGKFDYSTTNHVEVTVDYLNEVVSATGKGTGNGQSVSEWSFGTFPTDAAKGVLHMGVYANAADAFTVSNIQVTYQENATAVATPSPTEVPEPTVEPSKDWTASGSTKVTDEDGGYVITQPSGGAAAPVSYDLLAVMENAPADLTTADGVITVKYDLYRPSDSKGSSNWFVDVSSNTKVNGWGGGNAGTLGRLSGYGPWGNNFKFVPGTGATNGSAAYQFNNAKDDEWTTVTLTVDLAAKTVTCSMGDDSTSALTDSYPTGLANALYLNVEPCDQAPSNAVVLKVKNISASYAAPAPATIDGTVEVKATYEEGDVYEGNATALTATFDIPAQTTFEKVTVTATLGEKTASVSKTVTDDGITTVTGGTVVYGIVVNAIVTADNVTAVAE